MNVDDIRARLAQGDTVVVSLRDRNLIAQLGDLVVRIDRRTRWGNPYRMQGRGRAGHGNREEVVDLYREHLNRHPDLVADVDELRGRALACWCAPELCHGDALVELLRQRERAS